MNIHPSENTPDVHADSGADNNVPIYGSYDPACIEGLQETDFFDGLHCGGTGIERFFPGIPQALQQLRARGVVCLAAALYHSRPLDEAPQSYPDGLCAVIGSEGQGLTDAAVQACDMAVRIPMTDLVESLNAGVAGSVLLWHFRGV